MFIYVNNYHILVITVRYQFLCFSNLFLNCHKDIIQKTYCREMIESSIVSHYTPPSSAPLYFPNVE